MRFSNAALTNSALRRLHDRMGSMQLRHDQISSGKRIRRPSDDVRGISRTLSLHGSVRSKQQVERNAADGSTWVNIADSKLQNVVDRLHRAKELALSGASTISTGVATSLADEVAAVRQDILSMANSRHQGRGMFAGTAAADAVTYSSGAWTFTGDSNAIGRRIGDDTSVRINVTADDVFGFNSAKDLFTTLDDLEAAIRTGDTAGADTAVAEIDAALELVLGGLSRLGNAGGRIEAARIRNDADVIDLRSELSGIEDVDLAEAITQLQLEQAAYQAAVGALGNVISSSLASFLG